MTEARAIASPPEGEQNMAERIKAVARVLLVQHGYAGLRYADIAEQLSITRANIHYHFGSKKNLVDAVVEDYVEGVLTRFEAIWSELDTSYEDKVRATIELNRKRFIEFNGGLIGSRPWSLIVRMRNDADLLTERARSILGRFERIEVFVANAVRLARAHGELSQAAPADLISLQFTIIFDSAGSITQSRGGFHTLEKAYLAHIALVQDAYGVKA